MNTSSFAEQSGKQYTLTNRNVLLFKQFHTSQKKTKKTPKKTPQISKRKAYDSMKQPQNK